MKNEKIKTATLILLLAAWHISLINLARAEVVERVVAIVNDNVILLSELQDALQEAQKTGSMASGERVLNDMIDNLLLLNEARRFRAGAFDKNKKAEPDNSAVIREYVDRRINALIHIPYEDVEQYYQMNGDLYKDKEFFDVRDEIEDRLVEKELKVKLREHIEELRGKAYVRVQLTEGD